MTSLIHIIYILIFHTLVMLVPSYLTGGSALSGVQVSCNNNVLYILVVRRKNELLTIETMMNDNKSGLIWHWISNSNGFTVYNSRTL